MATMSLPLRTLAWVACVFAFCVIVFGSFVRLSNAGLSCPDWPTCYGRVTWPVKPAAVAKADQAFPHRPVEMHKAWREQSHRFLAGTLGLLVLAEALVATYRLRLRLGIVIAAVVLIGMGIPLYMAQDYVASSVVAAIGEALLLGCTIFWRGGGWRRIAVLALAVVCFQALLGMWTVTWLLKPIVVSGHLLGGMATFALLAWIAWRLPLDGAAFFTPSPPTVSSLEERAGVRGNALHGAPPPHQRFALGATRRLPPAKAAGERAIGVLPGFVAVGVILLACQIFLGGWTSSNYAALACGIGGSAFPTCLGQWWPAMNFHQGFIL